jgi:hypothetical protein
MAQGRLTKDWKIITETISGLEAKFHLNKFY